MQGGAGVEVLKVRDSLFIISLVSFTCHRVYLTPTSSRVATDIEAIELNR